MPLNKRLFLIVLAFLCIGISVFPPVRFTCCLGEPPGEYPPGYYSTDTRKGRDFLFSKESKALPRVLKGENFQFERTLNFSQLIIEYFLAFWVAVLAAVIAPSFQRRRHSEKEL